MKKVSDEDFLAAWKCYRSATEVAKYLNITERAVHSRRRRMETRLGEIIEADHPRSPTYRVKQRSPRVECSITDGIIMVASDAHYWPGVISTAHRAFVALIKELKPRIVVANGDMFDGAGISRHPPSRYETLPSVKEELKAVDERITEIEKAAKGADLWWCYGNHDQRFEATLASRVPEFRGVEGFTLKHHFPRWKFTMSLFVNQNLMIKHRYRNGVHATWNNTLYSGVSMCTGHLHRLQATIMGDYRGNRWGIDTGTLADTDGEHMHYGEDDPKNHCSGFAVLTFNKGRLLYPEFCSVHDGVPFFRGKEVKC